MLNVIWKS